MEFRSSADEVAHNIIDAVAEAVLIVDKDGIVRHASTAAESLFRRPASHCLDLPLSDLLTPAHQQPFTRWFQWLTTGPLPEGGVGYRAAALDGHQRPFDLALELGETRLDQQTVFLCLCRDLSATQESTEKRLSAESLNRALFEAAVDGIITIDSHGLIRSFNPAAETLFGFCRTEVIGKNVSILMPDHYARHHDGYIDHYLRTGDARIIGVGRDVVGQRKDGSRFPLHLSVGEAAHQGDRHFIGICHDLSNYHEALRKLAQAEKRYKDIVHSQSQMICRVDTDLNITFANRSLMECLGKSHQELIGTPLYRFVADNERSIQELLAQLFTSAGVRHLTLKLTMASAGRNRQVEWTFTRPESDEEHSELQGFGVDISEMVQARREAEYFRNYDTVTGLLNKQAFLRTLESWATSEPAFSVIHLDLDSFSLVNQKHGFEAGNLVLNEVARRLVVMAGKNSLVARTGADDFVVATPVSRLRDVKELTRKLSSGIGRNLPVDAQTLSIDVAIGVAFFPADSDDIQRLPDLAESAMREARLRHEPITLFDKASHSHLQRRLDIDQALKRAIEDQVPHILLQPKYRISSRDVCGFEALIRWDDPVLGTVSPAEFIPLVEHSKLGQRLDHYVILKAIEAIKEISGHGGRRLPVAINITPPHFSNPDLCRFILDQLRRTDTDPKLLEIELTEGVFLEPNATVIDNLATLRAAGVKIAIDDFGTGYSSLSYLRNLQVDELKVDRSFTNELDTIAGRTILQAVVLIARALDLVITAEGVETVEQLEELDGMGCHQAQGFYLSRPLPVDDIKRLLTINPEN